jgi:hypothetical protein
MNDVIVDAVFDARRGIGRVKEPLRVGFVLGEEKFRGAFRIPEALPEVPVREGDGAAGLIPGHLTKRRAGRGAAAGPIIAEPEGGQEVERGGFRAAVVHGDSDEQVLGGRLGVFDQDIKIAVLIKNPGVQQFILGPAAPALAVGCDEVVVGVGGLGILVEVLHVGMRRSRVQIEVVLLDILSMVALAVGQAEEPFLEDRVPSVP